LSVEIPDTLEAGEQVLQNTGASVERIKIAILELKLAIKNLGETVTSLPR